MLLSTLSTLHLNRSVIPKPVYLLTVQEAHKEYSSLTDQIRAKYEQLDSDSKGIIQAHVLQALKILFGSKLH